MRRTAISRVLPLAVLVALSTCESSSRESPGQAGEASRALQRADSIVAAWVEEGRVAGAVLAVVENGRRVHERAFGWAQLFDFGGGQYGTWRSEPDDGDGIRRLAEPRRMTTSTVFDLASVTKVMATTWALMLLVDDGLVEVDAPVQRYLPDFTGGGKDAVTVRHLLTHTAGLIQWTPVYYHASSPDAAYAYIRDPPLGWPVGAGRHYSDLGFMILGRIVETVTGLPLHEFVREDLYQPLGLNHTGFRPARRDGEDTGAPRLPGGPFAATSHGNPFEYRMVHDTTFGYRIEGDADSWDEWRRHTLVGEVNDGNAWHAFAGAAGHAGLFSTAGDLSVLLRVLLDGGALDGRRIVRRSVVDRFTTESVAGQALGWQVPDYAPSGSFVHTGFTGTYVLGVPSTGLGIVLLTNRQNTGVGSDGRYPDVGPLQRAVAEALLDGAR